MPPKNILLVEDTPELLETLRQLLEAAGHKVHCATTGDAALDVLRSESNFDVLITDVIVPNVDGLQLAAAVRKNHPKTKVILMSGGTAAEPALSQENFTILTKPFSGRELLDRLRD